jgi:hypothetical protein
MEQDLKEHKSMEQYLKEHKIKEQDHFKYIQVQSQKHINL